jgi:CheY-like chemotaxis protein
LKTSAPLKTYQLQQLINEAVLPCRQLASGQGIELEVINDMASSIMIVGDVKKQKTLLQLVLTNTISYSKASRVVFTTRQLLQSDKEALVEFSLVDNGRTPRLNRETFAYFRSLVAARALIEQLNGKSEFMASPGLNTTLKFIIKFEWQKNAATNGLALSKKLEGKKVLVAEDNEVNQKLIKQMLHKQGIIAHFAGNGKEAVTAFESDPDAYDLILMDLHMPYMDGLQATNYIRKKLCSRIPIVGLTMGAHEVDYTKCMEVGMNHFIKKPFTDSELLGAIDGFSESWYETAC